MAEAGIPLAAGKDEQGLGHREAVVIGHDREVGERVGDGAAEVALLRNRPVAQVHVGERRDATRE